MPWQTVLDLLSICYLKNRLSSIGIAQSTRMVEELSFDASSLVSLVKERRRRSWEFSQHCQYLLVWPTIEIDRVEACIQVASKKCECLGE